jgi:hypothetical protein
VNFKNWLNAFYIHALQAATVYHTVSAMGFQLVGLSLLGPQIENILMRSPRY